MSAAVTTDYRPWIEGESCGVCGHVGNEKYFDGGLIANCRQGVRWVCSIACFDKLRAPEIARAKIRCDLWDVYHAAKSCLHNAVLSGRRTGCLHAAVCELRGALRNVCFEDAEEFADPSIVNEFERYECLGIANRIQDR